MAVSMADISKLRALTGAGLMDCKKALAESNGDMDAAVEIVRKKGLAIAAKREDRQAAEGCVLAVANGEFACLVALKCETDVVASNAVFVATTQKVLNAALAAKAKSLDEVNALTVDGMTVEELIKQESGKTGEKMELGAYECIEAPCTVAYVHFGNKLGTLVGFNEVCAPEVAKSVALQVAAMNPVAVCREDVAQETIDKELAVAVEKTRAEQVSKFVNGALVKLSKEVGVSFGKDNYYAGTEEHINEAVMKGYFSEEVAAKIRETKESAAVEGESKVNPGMVENIAKGRLNKFFKESCLMEQEFIDDNKMDIATYLKGQSKTLKAVVLKRVNLNAE